MKTALIFPGQGSQTVGMGKALYDNFAVAREVFDEVDAALSEKLSDVVFAGPQEILTLTENAQPAIMATSMAALRVLQAEAGFDIATQASYVAGHSLGEYSALCAAGSISLTETARLLRVRGRSMQQAVPIGKGAMAALLGVDYEQAAVFAKEAAQGEICSVANDNAAGQVVISGTRAAVERAMEIAKANGVKRAVMLDVSAPFHCDLMAPAAGVMHQALGAATINAPIVPLVANVTAAEVTDPETIRQLLVDQVTGMVRWREIQTYLAAQGVQRVIEIGAGKVLTGLAKRITPDVATVNIGTPEDMQAFVRVE